MLLPHVGLTPIEVEKLKEFIAAFGFEVLALPDLSTSLDGHLGEKQSALSSGGIAVEQIRALGDAGLVLSVGASMRAGRRGAAGEEPGACATTTSDHLQGLEATDNLVALLLAETGFTAPPPAVARWRRRLQDALLDCHFALGQTRFLLAGEPDQLAGQCQALFEAGGQVRVAVATVDSPQLEHASGGAGAGRRPGGRRGAASRTSTCCSPTATAKPWPIAAARDWWCAACPTGRRSARSSKCDLLYEGGTHFLCEVANAASRWREEQAGHGAAVRRRRGGINGYKETGSASHSPPGIGHESSP